MTTKLKLISILVCIITLQSCSKEPHFIKLPDDKLLLSNVSGTFVDANWYGINAFEFNNQGMFNTSFVYGQKVSGSLKYRPLEKVQFIPTEYNANGNWDFVYNNHYLTHISDSTYPPRFGKQWVFSYNDKHQIEETKIINTDDFSIATYEHFVYNEKYQVVELKYGLSKKEIYYKVNYAYDNWGNLLSFACYFNDVDFGTSNKGSGELLSAPTNLKGTITPALINKKLQELLNSKRQGHRSAALTDNYVLLFNATITSDNAINPFSLQQSILFYASNHDYFYINDFFIPLMKSNPLKVSLVFAEDLGGGVVSQDYKYTYNQHKYPVTIEEKATDPTPWQYGDYVKTSKLVYIKNN